MGALLRGWNGMRDADSHRERQPRTNHVGERFGRLLIVEPAHVGGGRGFWWLCKCDCGNEIVAPHYSMRAGKTKSCGCYMREVSRITGGLRATHGKRNRPEYAVWRSMIARCTNPMNKSYPRYGGRGITVCDAWLGSFAQFWADMGARPDGYMLDRIDNEGNYEAGNCRWATPKQQMRNRRSNTHLAAFGKRQTIAEWAEESGLLSDTIIRRLARGWSIENSVSLPLKWGRHA